VSFSLRFLRPTQHKTGHFEGVLPSQSLGILLKKLNPMQTRNSSRDEIANVNIFYDDNVHEFGEITQNKGHYAVQGHRFWYQWKAHIRVPISD